MSAPGTSLESAKADRRAVAAASLRHRKFWEKTFGIVCLSAAIIGVLLLILLVFGVARDGIGRVGWDFINSFPSRFANKAGIKAAIFGTLWIIGITTLVAVPIGIMAGIYLEELAKPNKINRFIQLNISNLAGVPSIIYGLLGLAIFVRLLGLDRSVIAGALTMSLLILPMIIIVTQESLRAVPRSLREGSLALGATQWQTVAKQVLPAGIAGVLTGVILAISRAIGETAPLITIGALTFVSFVPSGPFDGFTALPIQIYNWSSRPQPEFHTAASAGIIVLLVILLSINSVAIILRNKYSKR
jgi:phosphate transport system permease protein